MTELRFIDLCCGMGSFHYSFKKLPRFKCVYAADISSDSRKVYKANFDMEPSDDIRMVDPMGICEYDIICAGFPCQPFSVAGLKKGFQDARGSIFSHIMRFVRSGRRKPRLIILENVNALMKHNMGKSFKHIQDTFESLGYRTVHNILKCSDFGIPQMRKRLFIVAYIPLFVKTDLHMSSFFNLDAFKKNITMSEYLAIGKFNKKHAYTIRCGGRLSPIKGRHNWDGYILDKKEYRLTIANAMKLQG